MKDHFSNNPKCSKIEWIKPCGFHSLTVLDSEVAAIHSSSCILFLPPHGLQQLIYEATSYLKGRGVKCLAGCPTEPLFAFAEKCSTDPRILVLTYPAFEKIAILSDQKLGEYSLLEFTEHECLVALKGLPSYEIQLWSWRSGKKLMYKRTGILSSNQILRVNGLSGGQITVAQLAPGTKDIILWEFTKCYDHCVLLRRPQGKLSDPEIFVDMRWTLDNSLILLNDRCELFKFGEDEKLIQLITQDPSVQGPHTPHLLTYKQGLVIFCSNGDIQLWNLERRGTKELTEVWTKTSELIQSDNMIEMATLYPADPDVLIGWSDQGKLVKISPAQSSIEILYEFGHKFVNLALLEPDQTHLVTLNTMQEVEIWLLNTGSLIGKMTLTTTAVDHLYANPVLPYVCLLKEPGHLLLVDCRDASSPQLAFDIPMCPGRVDEIHFSVDGACFVAANYEQGLLLVTDNNFSSLSIIETEERILSFCMESSKYLFVLVQDSPDDAWGKQILMYALADCSPIQILRCPKHLKTISHVPGKSQFMATLPQSRLLMFCRYVKFDEDLKINKILNSGQQLRQFYAKIYAEMILCFGRDGLVSLLNMKDGALVCTQVEHNWTDQGVKAAVLSKHGHVVSLGHSKTLICSEVKQVQELPDQHPSTTYHVLPSRLPRLQERLRVQGVSWLEHTRNQKQDGDQTRNRAKLAELQREFRIVQRKVQVLLNVNQKGPTDERLNIIEFDINLNRKLRILKSAEEECEIYRISHEQMIQTWNKKRDLIRQFCWDQMKEKTRAVVGIDRLNLQVEKYGLSQTDESESIPYKRLIERKTFDSRIVTKAFHPWDIDTFEKGDKEKLDTPDILKYKIPIVQTGNSPELSTKSTARRNEWFGSISHRFLKLDRYHADQFNIWTSDLIAKDENILLQNLVNKLRLYFNKKFDQVFREKERTLELIHQQIARLRHIQQDLVWPCNSSYPELTRKEVKWTQEEQVEMILDVLDEELPVEPYISPSEQDIIAQRLAEEERQRLLAVEDNFKERALMEMMDGVLELRWEDQLKQDVPKPQCMTKKTPDKWTDQDLAAVKDYESKVEQMMKDRVRYKVMLHEEWDKLVVKLEESIKEFDDKVFRLYCTKLKVEQAINQEQLKMLRISTHSRDSYVLHEEYVQLKDSLTFLEQEELPVALSVENQLQIAQAECKTNNENFVSKDKAMDKKFKTQLKNEYSNLLSKPQLDQMQKQYRKIPELKIISCPDVWLEMAQIVVNPKTTSYYLPADAQEVIEGVDILDKQTLQMSNIDMKIVEYVVRNRRLKIESHFKMKAAALELKEADATVALQSRNITALRDRIAHVRSLMYQLMTRQNEMEQDILVQLNMQQGQVELELSGHIEDFQRVHLITKSAMTGINMQVMKAGLKRMTEAQSSSHIKKFILAQECLQRKLKTHIEELREQIKRTERTKIYREILIFLQEEEKDGKCETKEKWLEKTDRDEQAMMSYYVKQKDLLDKELEKIDHQKDVIVRDIKQIENHVKDLTMSISLIRMNKDEEFDEQYEQNRKNRMKALLTRCTLLQKIQEKYLRLQMLKSDLSTLRCKTYPILKPQMQACRRD